MDRMVIDPLIGEVLIGRYRLDSELGQGGMGVVYRAVDLKLHQRPCAVKVLTGLNGDPQALARFDQEAQVIATLTSPNTVRVYDTGTLADGRPFIAMELLSGTSLEAALKQEKALDPARALKIIVGVLSALEEAHQAGVIHRDLKPANIFLVHDATGREHPKVLDFGVAKALTVDDSPGLTTGDGIIGTPFYMAPEQFTREQLSPQTDLYAVGLVLFEMLIGRTAFLPEDPVPESLQTMPPEYRLGWLHVNRRPPKIDGVVPDLGALISSLLAKSPDGRPSSAMETLSRVERLPHPCAEHPRIVNDETAWVGRVRRSSAHRARWALAAGVVAGLAGAGAYQWMKAPADVPAQPEHVVNVRAVEPPPGKVTVTPEPEGSSPLVHPVLEIDAGEMGEASNMGEPKAVAADEPATEVKPAPSEADPTSPRPTAKSSSRRRSRRRRADARANTPTSPSKGRKAPQDDTGKGRKGLYF